MRHKFCDICGWCGREFEIDPGDDDQGLCGACGDIERRERRLRREGDEE